MSHCTGTIEVRARKRHSCTWCAQSIERGEVHKEYTWIGDDGPMRTKMHQECEAASRRYGSMEGGEYEFTLGDFTRGCTCGAGDRGHGTYPECRRTQVIVVAA